MDLSRRSEMPEIMDDADISVLDYAQALRDLATVNRITRTHAPVLAWLRRATRDWPEGRAVSVLDVASGQGDLLRAIHSWATRRGLMPMLSGIDLNPRSAIEAVAATPTGPGIAWKTGDVFDQAPEPKPDFVVSSQFAHHLTDDQVVAFLLWLEQQPTRLVHRRPALPHAAILRLSPPLPRRGLASHRAPGRHGLDRPRLPHPGMASAARPRGAECQHLLASAVPPLRRPAEMTPPVVIAGGGLAGAAAACQLARPGREVTVIDGSIGPAHKICGEFVSIEAQHYLTRLGLDLAPLGGHPIDRVRLGRGASVIETRLPFQGLGLARFALDEALLRHAEASGATVRRGESVGSTDDISFLATGKHDLRTARRALDAAPEMLVGFKAYFRLAPSQQERLAHVVEVMLFPDGYAGLQTVENGSANLCLLIHRDHLSRLRRGLGAGVHAI